MKSELKYELILGDNVLLCKCATVVRNVCVWRQGVFLNSMLCLVWPCGSVWFWSSLTLRSPPGLAAHSSALKLLVKRMKEQDRLNQSLTHRNENRRARNSGAVRQASSAQEMEQKCFSSCRLAGLQTVVTKVHCHSGLDTYGD